MSMASAPAEPLVNCSDTVPHEQYGLKEKLINAAETCFVENGVAHTSMRDIAGIAGVSRTTLYKYYPRIEDILQAAFLREFDRFELKTKRKLARIRSPQERLEMVVIGLSENIPKSNWITGLVSGPRTKTEEKALAVGRSALDERVEKMISLPLRELAAQKKLRSDVEREHIVEWVRLIVHALSVVRHPDSFSKKQRRTLICKFLMKSVLR